MVKGPRATDQGERGGRGRGQSEQRETDLPAGAWRPLSLLLKCRLLGLRESGCLGLLGKKWEGTFPGSRTHTHAVTQQWASAQALGDLRPLDTQAHLQGTPARRDSLPASSLVLQGWVRGPLSPQGGLATAGGQHGLVISLCS